MTVKHHTSKKCSGYGHVFVSPSVVGLIRTTLEHDGFAIVEKKIGTKVKLIYGSQHCPPCSEWLRR